jgi:hypothetical protein
MQNRREDARWSFKDHGFVYDIENVKNEYKHKVRGKLALKKEYKPIYKTWYDMAKRTTNPERQAKKPTYKDTWVCEEWKYFSNFLNWSLANGYRKGLDLDKDILDIGNKCYSPDTCVFVSRAINTLLVYKQSDNSGLPIGVGYQEFNHKGYKRINPYRLQVSINGEQKYIDSYATPEEAGLAYGREKSKHIIDKANNLTEEDCSLVHREKVKNALMNHAKSLEEDTENLYGGNTLY